MNNIISDKAMFILRMQGSFESVLFRQLISLIYCVYYCSKVWDRKEFYLYFLCTPFRQTAFFHSTALRFHYSFYVNTLDGRVWPLLKEVQLLKNVSQDNVFFLIPLPESCSFSRKTRSECIYLKGCIYLKNTVKKNYCEIILQFKIAVFYILKCNLFM